jgi:adenylate cyclase class 2
VASTLEREIKLRFETPEAARAAVVAAGASPLRGRRLQEDCLLDTSEGRLRERHSVLRLRMERGRSLLTFKGPVQPSSMKVREEVETLVGDGEILLRVLEAAGFQIRFRYQKYREEFAVGDVIVAIDETPVGTFVEIEGSEQGITALARALARSPADYVLESYQALFMQHLQSSGLPPTDMLFESSES